MMEQSHTAPRTQGDGMENHFSPEKLTGFKHDKDIFTKGQKINLIPGPLIRLNRTKYNIYKKKEPKFVLYEPYKAAVKPLIPPSYKQNTSKDKKKMKNNLDCNELVSHILFMSSNELILQKGIPLTCVKKNDTSKYAKINVSKLDSEKQNLASEIDCLRNENSILQSQLTFQAQVNAELKSMLVAAVGEDVETRVHLLTEDKLHLAAALLKSVENLSTHQEQIEWLAGQCEVWRSKFLASSLMIEELANSKHILSKQVRDLMESMKSLLSEMHQVRDKQSLTLQNLNKMINGTTSLPTSDIIDMNEKCYQLSELLFKKLSGKNKCVQVLTCNSPSCNTPAQAQAEKLLTNSPLIDGSDIICKAVVSSANFISK